MVELFGVSRYSKYPVVLTLYIVDTHTMIRDRCSIISSHNPVYNRPGPKVARLVIPGAME